MKMGVNWIEHVESQEENLFKMLQSFQMRVILNLSPIFCWTKCNRDKLRGVNEIELRKLMKKHPMGYEMSKIAVKSHRSV